ncbi:DNA repair protein RecO [Patescibacteria group bacterium]|nr:DNA repair protein RecO [Patescibacteria group bacterium]
MRNKVYKTPALIVGRRNFSDVDRIITVLTKDFGRRDLMVKGIRKHGHKWGGILEPFMMIDLVGKVGNNFDYVRDVDLICDYAVLEDSLNGFGLTNMFLEVVSRVSYEGETGELFELARDYLNCWERKKFELVGNVNVMLYMSSFIMSVLAISGRLPVIDVCLECGKSIDQVGLVLGAQGVFHRQCVKGPDEVREMSTGEYGIFKKVITRSCEVLIEDGCEGDLICAVLEKCVFVYNQFWQREVRSFVFMKNLMLNEE